MRDQLRWLLRAPIQGHAAHEVREIAETDVHLQRGDNDQDSDKQLCASVTQKLSWLHEQSDNAPEGDKEQRAN